MLETGTRWSWRFFEKGEFVSNQKRKNKDLDFDGRS